MKRRIPSLLLSLLLLLSLAACGGYDAVSSTEIHYSDSDVSSGLVDLPVLDPEDGSQVGSLPDGSQNLPDGSQGNEAEGNRPDGKSSEGNGSVDEDGWYTSKEEVALYIHLYGDLPDNYVTKSEAEDAGWSGGNVERYTGEGTAIGGSRFGNREGLLPKEQGRTYTECDIDTVGENSRGAKRIVFSNDGLVYYTDDHYESFELLYGEP
ncbi:MAG: ribonuclease [Lawsonibacter sp.]|nr:ribonuclease [Lawsonibacter sp.]